MPPHTLDTPYRCNFLRHRDCLIARHTIPHRLHNQERHSLHSMWNNLPPGSADKQNNRNHTQHIINVIPRIIRQQNRNKTRQKPPHLHFPKRPVQFHHHPQINKPQNSHPIIIPAAKYTGRHARTLGQRPTAPRSCTKLRPKTKDFAQIKSKSSISPNFNTPPLLSLQPGSITAYVPQQNVCIKVMPLKKSLPAVPTLAMACVGISMVI